MSGDPTTRATKGTAKPPSVDRISAGWLKGAAAAASYAGVSPKVISQWLKAGFLTPRVLSKRLFLFRPEDIDRAVEQAALAFADSQPIEGQE